MDTRELERTLNDLTSTLGDPTRRAIYLTARESVDPVTATGIAKRFAIHPNVARHHLDRLTDEGYLQVTRRRPEGKKGPGAGRPARCYAATDKEIEVQFPVRRYDLLADLLVRVVQRLGPGGAAEVAIEVGREYGKELAARLELPDPVGFKAALSTVTQAMTGVGFDVDADSDHRQLHYSHCPFGQTALDHPEVVCSLDRGIVSGLMEALHQRADTVVVHRAAHGEDCVTTV